MDYEKLSEILRFSTPKSLLIVNYNNLLKELFCPFFVVAMSSIGKLEEGETYSVEEIRVTKKLKTVYIILGDAYYYNHFEIFD